MIMKYLSFIFVFLTLFIAVSCTNSSISSSQSSTTTSTPIITSSTSTTSTQTTQITSTAATPATQIVWKLQGIVAADATGGKSDAWFAQEINKRSNGRLTIDYYPSVGLGVAPPNVLPALRNGLLEVACAFSVFLGAEVPIMDVMGLPNITKDDLATKQRVSDAIFSMQKEAMLQKDVVLLGTFCTTGRNYYTKAKLTSSDQLQGLKLRTAGPTEAAIASAFGCVPTTLASADIYTGLERGIVDAVSMPSNGITEWNLEDFLTTCFPFRTVFTPWDLLVSAQAFNSLPDDLKTLVLDVGKEAYDLGWEWDVELSEQADKTLKDSGVVYLPVTADDQAKIDQASDEYNTAWLTKAGSAGTQIMDIINKTK